MIAFSHRSTNSALPSTSLLTQLSSTLATVLALPYSMLLRGLLSGRPNGWFAIFIFFGSALLVVHLARRASRGITYLPIYLAASLVLAVSSVFISVNAYPHLVIHSVANIRLGGFPFGSRELFCAFVPIFLVILIWIQKLEIWNSPRLGKRALIVVGALLFFRGNAVFNRLAPSKAEFPTVGFSRWRSMQADFETGAQYCIPINPYPWVMGERCHIVPVDSQYEIRGGSSPVRFRIKEHAIDFLDPS
ncbi:MAG: hypothetical protein EOP06_27865 [Proteobacteria bacterium]|nr:MAG: hypothetical protein EOP06_27865 [Pseudomonadota bacterium]